MRAAVEDVHHGNGQDTGACAAEVAVERGVFGSSGGAGGRHGDGEDGICAETSLGGRAIELDHSGVELGLSGSVFAVQHLGDLAVDVADGVQGTFAEVARFIAIAQFDGFIFSGGSAGGDGGPAHAAVSQIDIGFDGRIAA